MTTELSAQPITRQIVRRKVASCHHGPNVRSDLGSEEDLRRLGRSIRKRQLTPWLILPNNGVLDGNRSLAACLLEGVEEADCIVVEEALTPSQYKAIQLAAANHRSDLSAYDKAIGVRDIRDDNPGLSNKQIADELLDMDGGYMTKLLSLFGCLPEVQQAAKDGKLGANDWYAISKSDDQLAMLQRILSGASREQVAQAIRKQKRGQPRDVASRVQRVKIPLAINTDDATVNGVATVAGLPGQDISLDDAENILREALKAVRDAQKRNLDIKTFQSVMKDMAAAT